MNIKKSVEHFLWKLNPKNKQWRATTKDVEAINGIMAFVNQKHIEQLNNNQLFAKLYINYYAELSKYYKSTVFDVEPQKELHRLLETPMIRIIQDFVDTVNDIAQAKAMEIEGKLKHPNAWTKKERDAIKIIEPIMDYETAEKNLTAMVNLALNSFH
jgi:hypothetical protein